MDQGGETDPEMARPGFTVVQPASLYLGLAELGVTLEDFQGAFWLSCSV